MLHVVVRRFLLFLCFNKKTYALYAAKDIQKKDGRDLVGSEILRWDSETKVYAELPNRPGFTGCTISGAINETMNGSYLFDPEGETHLDRKNSEKWGHHYPAVWWKPDRSYFMYVLFNKSTCMYEHRVNHGKFYDDTISQLLYDQETVGAPAFLFRGDCDDIDGNHGMWQEYIDDWVKSKNVVVAASKPHTGTPAVNEEQDGFSIVEQFIQSQKAMHEHKKRRK